MKRLCATCNKKRDESRFVGARGKTCDLCRKKKAKETARRNHLWKTYNITLEEYDAMCEGGCDICHGTRPYNLAVDHDHAIAEAFSIRESIRGVLCKRCNKLLRDVRDSGGMLLAAETYLRNPPAKNVLYPIVISEGA